MIRQGTNDELKILKLRNRTNPAYPKSWNFECCQRQQRTYSVMRGTIPIRTRRRRNLGTSRLWIVLCWLLVSVFLCWFCFCIFASLVTTSLCFVLSALSALFCCLRFASCLVFSLLLDFYISLYTCFILFVIIVGHVSFLRKSC